MAGEAEPTEPTSEPLVLVADDSPVIRGAVRDQLSSGLGMDPSLIVETDNAFRIGDLINSGELNGVRVAVLDGRMQWEGDGKQVARDLRELFPDIKIVSLSADRQNWGDVNLEKDDDPEKLLNVMRVFLDLMEGNPG